MISAGAVPERGTVLVVDDSALMRAIVTDALGSVPGLTVVGQVSTGGAALDAARRLDPDIISLDIELPDMSGLDVLRRVMDEHPTKVILVSAHTERGADITLRGLGLGALDFVAKGRLEPGPDGFAARLQRTFQTVLAARHPRRRPAPAAAPSAPETERRLKRLKRPQLVCIAASTGGPPALEALLASFTSPPMVPMVIVQHMPPGFTTRLAHRLDQAGAAKVIEASEGSSLVPGTVLIAAGSFHLHLTRTTVGLGKEAPVGALKPRADITMSDAARAFGSGVLGVVLTGMGDDGLAGCRAIVAAGGQVIAQDSESSVVDGMPRQVREAGFASMTGSPAHLGEILHRLVGRTTGAAGVADRAPLRSARNFR